MDTLFAELTEADCSPLRKIDLSRRCSFRIGGTAEIGVFPKTQEAFIRAVRLAKKSGFPWHVVGKGSNLLFHDGYREEILIFTDGLQNVWEFDTVSQKEKIIQAEAGVFLPELVNRVCKKGFSGLEFACGIPGSLGGAVVMNAGAFGGEMSQIVRSVICYDTNADSLWILKKKDLQFAYRSSIFSDNPYLFVLETALTLQPSDVDTVREKIEKYRRCRSETQPHGFPSAGSFFKRPEESVSAGALIEKCGLKGLRVGDAEISSVHAGFLINRGNATARDVMALVQTVRDTVMEKTGIRLEPEVRTVI